MGSSSTGGPEIFGSGVVPQRSDSIRMLLSKELRAINAGVGGTGTGNVLNGSGAPVAAPASGRGIYRDDDTGAFYYYGPPSNTWQVFIAGP